MEELGLGPNGALLYCMEYLEDHLGDWLQDVLSGFGEDDYVLFDCPGQVRGHIPVKRRAHRDRASQVELYSHASVFRSFVDQLKSWGWNMCVVYLLDSQFIVEAPKFISGCLAALSAMLLLELPHVNVLSKVDLLRENQAQIEQFLQPEARQLSDSLSSAVGRRYPSLHQSIASLLGTYSLVSFVPLDVSEEESIAELLQCIDGAIQFGEDADVRTSTELS